MFLYTDGFFIGKGLKVTWFNFLRVGVLMCRVQYFSGGGITGV